MPRTARAACLVCACAVWCAAGCAPSPAAQRGESPASSPVATAVDVRATAVPLNPDDPRQDRVGGFTYAGGVELTAGGRLRFGGLSDLAVLPDGRLLSVTDEGQLVEARLTFGPDQRLTGVTDVSMTPLVGEDGRVLGDKSWADAEGVAVLPGGDRLVSFEREHRVWRYPASHGSPVPAPAPAAARDLPFNGGLEALAAMPADGPGAYLLGSEGGVVWQCDLAGGCRETALGARVPSGLGLSAIAMAPDGRTLALVGRAFDEAQGVRVVVRLVARDALTRPDPALLLGELPLRAPLTSDNFEGAALVPQDGGLRLYLLSDNNYSATQHTYLLAFDWRPAP